MGLSGEIIVGGLPPTMRPIFETQPVLLRLKVVPTTFQPHLAGDCGVWHDNLLFCLPLLFPMFAPCVQTHHDEEQEKAADPGLCR